ncbi:MAG: hypothetical protein ABR972_15985 [Acidimicrobiales bacterium]
MSEPVRFGDASVETRAEFLKQARRRYPGCDATGPWYCGACGMSFPLDDVIIVDSDSGCSNCAEPGDWGIIFPLD